MLHGTPFTRGRFAGLLVAAALVAARPAGASPETLPKLNAYGITLALAGRTAAAESAFVALLSQAPRDARALTNLGNLALMRGEAEIALAFYERALAADAGDPGIVLDRSAALLLQGDNEQAQIEAARGVKLAGGAAAAAALLGVTLADSAGNATAARGAETTTLSRAEIADLLAGALAMVPADSSATLADLPRRPVVADSTRTKVRLRRSAGPRGSDGTATAQLLYWKKR